MKTGRLVLFYCFVVAAFVFPGHTLVFRSPPSFLQSWGHGSRVGERIPQMKTGRCSSRAPGTSSKRNWIAECRDVIQKKGLTAALSAESWGRKQFSLSPSLTLPLFLPPSLSHFPQFPIPLLTLPLPIYLYINYILHITAYLSTYLPTYVYLCLSSRTSRVHWL